MKNLLFNLKKALKEEFDINNDDSIIIIKNKNDNSSIVPININELACKVASNMMTEKKSG